MRVGVATRVFAAVPTPVRAQHQPFGKLGVALEHHLALADDDDVVCQVVTGSASHHHLGSTLTCAATTRQPSAIRTQVWLCRPRVA